MNLTPRPKSLAMMFLLGAFLTGGALGFVTDRTMFGTRQHGRPMTERQMRDELQQQLALTEAQRVLVDSAYDWRRNRIGEIMQQFRPQIDAVRDTARQRVLSALNPTQVTRFRFLLDSTAKADSVRRARADSIRHAKADSAQRPKGGL